MKRYLTDYRKIKIIIILRNPTDRAFSHYCMFKLYGLENLIFEEAIGRKQSWQTKYLKLIDYLGMGLYYKQIEAYLENFEKVKIFLYEDLKNDPQELMRSLLEFLEIDRNFKIDTGQKFNISGEPRSRLLNAIINNFAHFVFNRKSFVRETIKNFANLIIDWDSFWHSFSQPVVNLIEKIRIKNSKQAKINPETRKFLINYYRDDILKLQDLIKRDLSSWLG